MEPIDWVSPLLRRFQPQHPESPDTVAQPIWTSARCNRLLRPLSSKLALLRKSQVLGAKRVCERRKESQNSVSHSTDDNCAFPTDILSAATKVIYQTSIKPTANISDWTPSPRPQKRIKRTYSSREIGHVLYEEPAKSDASTSTETISKFHSESLIRILSCDSKILEKPAPTRVQPSGQNCILNTEARIGESFRRFAKSRYPDRWQLIDGIQTGLESLLKVTSKVDVSGRPGARSLFSTCLRSVPQYIATEETWSKTEDPENKEDVCSAIYSELEAYGSSLSGGWKPLRQVVRAHGVAMLGSAVKDGLIELPIANNLVKICLHHGAFDEGQHIVECMIAMLGNLPKSASNKARIVGYNLSVLNQFASFSGRFGFQYRQLGDMFRNGTLPVEWILSDDMIECWGRAMLSVIDGDSASRDAGILLQTGVLMSSGALDTDMISKIHCLRLQSRGVPKIDRMKSHQVMHTDKVFRYPHSGNVEIENIEIAMETTNSYLGALVGTIDLLQNSATITGSGELAKARPQVLQGLVLQICQVLEIGNPYLGSGSNKLDLDRVCLSLLAAGVSSAISGNTVLGLDYHLDIIEDVRLSQEFSNSAASFFCALADCCGRASSDDGFLYIQKIVQELVGLYTSCNRELATRVLIGKIAASAAIEYSRSTSIPKHLSWALEIESLVNRMTVGMDAQTPSKTPRTSFVKTKLGFRWEEGICEWIAGTPSIQTPKTVVYRDQGSTSLNLDLDHDIAPADASQSSPDRAPTCLVQIPLASSKRNGKTASLEKKLGSFGNRSHGVFLHVGIENICPINAQSQSEKSKGKADSFGCIQNTRLSCARDKSEKLCTLGILPELPKYSFPRPKIPAPCVRCKKGRCHEHQEQPSEHTSACDTTNRQPVHKPSLITVESPIDQEAESADELSFS